MKNIEKFIEESIDNIRDDRAIASAMLIDVMKHIKTDDSKHQYFGPVAAKYLETLQRSNEQLVKIISLIQKKNSSQKGLSEEDKENIYDVIRNKE